MLFLRSLAVLLVVAVMWAQPPQQLRINLNPAESIHLPFVVDSNTPSLWRDGNLVLFHSDGEPMRSTFVAATNELITEPVAIDTRDHFPMWIESVYQQGDALYAWYHHERIGVCPGSSLNVPEIGALVSRDGGRSFTDLGIVLNSGAPDNCAARNGYFANGHGDFSVIAGRQNEYLYFLFGAYGGDLSRQGVAIARMPVGNLDTPVGSVWKYDAGSWNEPGLGGQITPIFPAAAGWELEATDSYWGPSVHWNTYLNRYVVLLNRSCCGPGWPQEGIYIAMCADLSDPSGWSAPTKLLESGEWYPWILPEDESESNATSGARSRLFVRQDSEWELSFVLEDFPPSEPAAPADPPDPPQLPGEGLPPDPPPLSGTL